MGSGNFRYPDAVEFLKLSEEQSPGLIKEFEDDFFGNNYSEVLYESDEVRVIDVTLSESLEKEGDNRRVTYVEEEAIGDGIERVSYRRLEFVKSSMHTQSEIRLNPESGSPDHASALIFPVHRVMSTLLMAYYAQEHEDPNGREDGPLRLAMIGAGGCTFPMHLLHLTGASVLPPLCINAIEPSAEVLDIAQRYFGAAFSVRDDEKNGLDSYLYMHCMTGESFFHKQSLKKDKMPFDVVVIDAMMAGSVIDSAAPPSSLLSPTFLSMLKEALAQKASSHLLVNVIGSADWRENVKETVHKAFNRGYEGNEFWKSEIVPAEGAENQSILHFYHDHRL